MNARTLQASTRESPSITLASTEKLVAVERTRKLVAVKLTSGFKDCVQQQEHTRKEAVQKLIHKFETHPNREALQADLKQNHAFNPFSEQSKEIICSMGNMKHCEICEITPKVQCHNCMTYWILHLRNMLATFRQNSNMRQRSL